MKALAVAMKILREQVRDARTLGLTVALHRTGGGSPLICRPMWRWFCEMARLAGVMLAGAGEGVVPAEWVMPSWSSVNPLQDAQTRLLSGRTGTTSLTEEVAREGWDLEDLVEEIAAERELLTKNGLTFEGDPQTFQTSGAAQAASDAAAQTQGGSTEAGAA